MNTYIRPFFLFTLISIFLISYSCKDDAIEIDESVDFVGGEIVPPTETSCGSFTTLSLTNDESTKIGEVVIANDVDSLYITINTQNDWFFSETFLYIGDKRNIPVNDQLVPSTSDFPLKSNHDPLVQSFQYAFILDEIDACEDVLLLINAKQLSSTGAVIKENRIWMEGSPLEGIASEGTFNQYCLNECIVKYPVENVATMAFEDLYPEPGDNDYNDFVAGMNAELFYQGAQIKRVEMTFTALARGSGFDHIFMLGFPIDGSANITIRRYKSIDDAEPYEVEELLEVGGADLRLNIFPSTKLVLPSPTTGTQPHTNTFAGSAFNPPAKTEVSVVINQGVLLLEIPFDPILKVINSTNSEIHIAELTQRIDADGDGEKDYWESGEAIYPFGIVMFVDWKWPLEFESILNVYPDFKYIFTEGIFRPRDPEWYLKPKEGSKYFERELFL